MQLLLIQKFLALQPADLPKLIRRTNTIFAAIIWSSCSPCFADAGTPLVLLTWANLFIGNLFIGLLEALILARIFRVKYWRAACLMVTANYVSSFIGLISMQKLALALFESNKWLSHLNMLPTIFWELFALLFVITVLVEWPFVFFVLTPRKERLYKSLLALRVSAVLFLSVAIASLYSNQSNRFDITIYIATGTGI